MNALIFTFVLNVTGRLLIDFGIPPVKKAVEKFFYSGNGEMDAITLNDVSEQLDILPNSVLALQSTTSLIGVGDISGGILSAVNLHQLLKLREEVRQGRLEVKEGFLDLKTFVDSQNSEIINRLDNMEKNIIFSHHHTILSQAYNEFHHALDYLKDSCKLSDINQRNKNITDVRAMLINALKTYNNVELLKDNNAPGELRRKECAWAINQTITITYQLQEAYEVVSDRLLKLEKIIKKDCINLIDKCQSQEELDFIFPEILAINNNDLKILQCWKNVIDTLLEKSSQEIEEYSITKMFLNPQNIDLKRVPKEQLIYNELKITSHSLSLKDQLRLIIETNLRQQYESEIYQMATNTKYAGLVPQKWENVPDQTITNLYWFLKQAINSNNNSCSESLS